MPSPLFVHPSCQPGTGCWGEPDAGYDHQRHLFEAEVFDASEVDAFAEAYFVRLQVQHLLYALLAAPVERFSELGFAVQAAFKTRLAAYVRLYPFLAPFVDADLERLYQFGRYLLLKLPKAGTPLPIDVQQAIDIESFKIQQTSEGSLSRARLLMPRCGVGAPSKGAQGTRRAVHRDVPDSRCVTIWGRLRRRSNIGRSEA